MVHLVKETILSNYYYTGYVTMVLGDIISSIVILFRIVVM